MASILPLWLACMIFLDQDVPYFGRIPEKITHFNDDGMIFCSVSECYCCWFSIFVAGCSLALSVWYSKILFSSLIHVWCGFFLLTSLLLIVLIFYFLVLVIFVKKSWCKAKLRFCVVELLFHLWLAKIFLCRVCY